MVKKTGLGKGLEALFNENQLTKEEEMKLKNGEEIVQNLKLIDIEPNRDQPRRTFNSESLEELATSIKRYGVIQPIIVTKMDNYYQIVAGERRWRAAKKAGLMEIPCLVRDSTERKNREIALIENIQREDLNIIEIARAIKELMEIDGYTQSEVAKITGKSLPTISNIMRLLRLPDKILDYLLNGKLVEGQARALLALDDEKKQIEIADKIIEKHLTVREVEKLIYGAEEYERKANKKQPKTVYYQKLEEKLKNYFGYKVKIDSNKKHQKLVIEYDDEDGLESLLSKLNIEM